MRVSPSFVGSAGPVAPVTGIAWRGNEFALSSRYVSERVLLGDNGLRRPGDALLDALRRIADGGRVVLFPERDSHVELVLRHWDAIREIADVPLPGDPDVVRRLRRKERLVLEAEKAGVAAPGTVAGRARRRSAPLELQLAVPREAGRGPGVRRRLRAKALRRRRRRRRGRGLAAARERGFETVVQELVPDARDQVFSLFTYIGRTGEPLANVVGRKVRRRADDFGTAAVFELGPEPRGRERACGSSARRATAASRTSSSPTTRATTPSSSSR